MFIKHANHQHCSVSLSPAVCRLPMGAVPCTGQQSIWAFDSTAGLCVPYKQGFCQTNSNKFYTKAECEEYCGVVKEGEKTDRDQQHKQNANTDTYRQPGPWKNHSINLRNQHTDITPDSTEKTWLNCLHPRVIYFPFALSQTETSCRQTEQHWAARLNSLYTNAAGNNMTEGAQ